MPAWLTFTVRKTPEFAECLTPGCICHRIDTARQQQAVINRRLAFLDVFFWKT